MPDNSIIRLFNDIAPWYDFLNHFFSCNLDRHWRMSVSGKIEIAQDAILLDCCTGTADMAIAAAKSHPGMICGIDLSEKMLRKAKQKISQKPFREKMLLLEADTLCLPFRSGSIGALTLGFGLRNLLNREQGLREIMRVLKEEGQLLLLEFVPPRKTFLGFFYHLYLGIFIPIIGKFVSKSHSAYQYLHASIADFLEPQEIEGLLEDNGFEVITARPLTCGIVYLFIARKRGMAGKKVLLQNERKKIK